MAATIVHANVNSLGEAYKDQTPSVEIRVPYSRASGLPYRAGERVSVKLKIGKRWYDGKLHASAGTKFVYFSPTLARNGTETTLGHVLKKFGVGVNERVQLHVNGTRIQVRDKWGNGFHTSASKLNRAIGSVPKPLTQIRDESGVHNPRRVHPHMKWLRDEGLVTQLGDGRYAETSPGDVLPDGTIAQRILMAVAALVGPDLAAEFSRNDVRKVLGVPSAVWGRSHSPIFQGMRADHPGGAPHVAAEYSGVFRRVSHGLYTLSEHGRSLVRGYSSQATGTPAKTKSGGGGAGFGAAENNKLVEEAARKAVWDMYEAHGWEVKSVESLKCGHDLECRKGTLEEHVEVKGTSGTEESFPITAGEKRAAEKDPLWHLCVVTSALSPEERKVRKYTGDDFLVKFDFKVLQYMAKLSR